MLTGLPERRKSELSEVRDGQSDDAFEDDSLASRNA